MLCSDKGHIRVDDVTRCKEAAERFGLKLQGTVYSAGWPKGCYQSKFDRHLFYFNKHDFIIIPENPHGKNSGGRQICRAVGKGLHS